jgi:hypothetical protein
MSRFDLAITWCGWNAKVKVMGDVVPFGFLADSSRCWRSGLRGARSRPCRSSSSLGKSRSPTIHSKPSSLISLWFCF